MKLSQLLRGLEPLEISADVNMSITHVTSDSGKVQPGSLFVAVAGFAADGNGFIPMFQLSYFFCQIMYNSAALFKFIVSLYYNVLILL